MFKNQQDSKRPHRVNTRKEGSFRVKSHSRIVNNLGKISFQQKQLICTEDTVCFVTGSKFSVFWSSFRKSELVFMIQVRSIEEDNAPVTSR